jgi:hypothetical protein
MGLTDPLMALGIRFKGLTASSVAQQPLISVKDYTGQQKPRQDFNRFYSKKILS